MHRFCGTANRVISVSIITNRRIIPQAFYRIRTMSTVNKSESEWRAILSPEQVRTFLVITPRFSSITNSLCSSEFFVRRALSALELASMISTRLQVFTVVPGAEHRYTRALPNSMCVF